MNDNRFKSIEELPVFLHVSDLSRALGLSKGYIYTLIEDGNLPAVIIGSRRLVRKENFLKWLDAHENRSTNR